MTQPNSFEDVAMDYKTLGRLVKKMVAMGSFCHLFKLKDVAQEETKKLRK